MSSATGALGNAVELYGDNLVEEESGPTMHVYTAGPMTGHPQFNFPIFDLTAEHLRAEGYEVTSPAELDDPNTRRAALASPDGAPGSGAANGETWGDFLSRDVKLIGDVVDAVAVLPAWESSRGARLETFAARISGKPVYEYLGPAAGSTPFRLMDDEELDRVLGFGIPEDSPEPQESSDGAQLWGLPIVVDPTADDIVVTEETAQEVLERLDEAHVQFRVPRTLVLPDLNKLADDRYAPTEPDVKPTNPKDVIGSDKVPLHLWPTTASVLGAMALLDGASKYGRSNWREAGVRYSIYYDAVRRHMDAAFEGEDVDPDSGLPHEAHALASLAIIVDAKAAGQLVDDRAYRGEGYRQLVTSMTEEVARIREKYTDRSPHHFTIADDRDED